VRRTFSVLVVAAALVALLAACSSGTTTGGSAGGSTSSGATAGSSADPGAQIFSSGVGHAGAIPRSMMGGAYGTQGPPCAMCHGAQGQGTGIGPNITRAVLGSKHTITHKSAAGSNQTPSPVSEGPWTTAQTVEAVKIGTTPEGNKLGGRMPHWQLDAQDSAALAAYLGKL
jgi:mono/diheme cytochrome c family protein